VTISGSSLGFSRADVGVIRIGDQTCSDLNATDIRRGRLSCVAPRGIGAGLSVEVENAFGLSSSPNQLLSYEFPVVTTINPKYIFRGAEMNDTVDIVINGTAFGQEPADLADVYVGDTNCTSRRWISSTAVTCIGLRSNDVMSD